MNWSVIVPAAGKGTRLGSTGSKLFYPLCGNPLYTYLLPHFTFCKQIIVLAPYAGQQDATPHNFEFLKLTVTFQYEQLGMADAVACGLKVVDTEFVCVVWGDLVVLYPDVIARAVRMVEEYKHDTCVPIMAVDRPYTHLDYLDGKVVRVLQRREGDTLPDVGVSDIGMFFFRTAALRAAMAAPVEPGAETGELNFLPVLTRFAAMGSIGATENAVLSVNTPEEARRAERAIWARRR